MIARVLALGKRSDFLSRHLRKSCYRSCYRARPSSRSAIASAVAPRTLKIGSGVDELGYPVPENRRRRSERPRPAGAEQARP